MDCKIPHIEEYPGWGDTVAHKFARLLSIIGEREVNGERFTCRWFEQATTKRMIGNNRTILNK